MKIFLDDVRKVKDELQYTTVRTYDECILLISIWNNRIEMISIDYSLGTEKTGFDVLVYMVENGINPHHINIHSDHSIGVPMMRKFAENNFEPTTIIT